MNQAQNFVENILILLLSNLIPHDRKTWFGSCMKNNNVFIILPNIFIEITDSTLCLFIYSQFQIMFANISYACLFFLKMNFSLLRINFFQTYFDSYNKEKKKNDLPKFQIRTSLIHIIASKKNSPLIFRHNLIAIVKIVPSQLTY